MTPSDKTVYIGGFDNGKKLARNVGEALGTDDVFTFSYAMDNPAKIAHAVRGAKLYMHSSAIDAVKGTNPAEMHAVAPPLPSSATGLVLRTAVKTAKMTGHSLSGKDALKAVGAYDASAIAEFARHPVGNLKHLRTIAHTDSIKLASAAQEAGIMTRLYFMDRDDYGFIPNDEQRAFAHVLGVELHLLEGRHDQLPLYPAQTLEQMNSLQ